MRMYAEEMLLLYRENQDPILLIVQVDASRVSKSRSQKYIVRVAIKRIKKLVLLFVLDDNEKRDVRGLSPFLR